MLHLSDLSSVKDVNVVGNCFFLVASNFKFVLLLRLVGLVGVITLGLLKRRKNPYFGPRTL